MNSLENERVPSLDELCSKIPILSEYCAKLDDSVKRRYVEKIAEIGVDPVTIPDQQFDTECLPPIEAMDLLSYLVLETSFYTKEQFKAYKSLEAYNFVVSGFLSGIQGCVVAGKHVVTGKVRHSQRMNDPLISVWVVAEKDGTVKSAHCLGCKAGLSETCSHVASVLFYIEAWTRIRGKLACTQVKCTWLLPSFVKDVPYAKMRDINLTSARKLKADLDEKIDSLGEAQATSFTGSRRELTVQVPTETEMNILYESLDKSKIKPVALSLIKPYSDQFVSESSSIQTIPDLFDNDNLNLTYTDLLKKCFNVEICLSSKDIAQIERDTQSQANGSAFFRHRAGRIGASMSGAVCRTNPAQPSQSLIKTICYPNLFKVNTKAVIHGCKHEADAIKAYEEEMKNSHDDFKLSQCGLVINQEYPWIHATPDFLVSCSCCGLGCGEVKCPICIDRCDFDSYVLKKNACLEKAAGNFQLKRNHNYFFQVQQQLLTLPERKYNDFVVCAFDSSHRATIIKERIYPDHGHWKEVLPKLTTFWRTCILPEILGRWYTRKCDISDEIPQAGVGICFCRMPSCGNTVKCGNPHCPFVEFHPSCLAISTPLPRVWYCPHCCRLPQFKRSKKGKEKSPEIMAKALSLNSICICQAVPQQSDKLLECHSDDCQSGKFFHLTCLGYKKLPNNSKTTWKCTDCKTKHAKPFHASTAVPGTCQETPVAPTTCFSQSHDDKPASYELDNAQESDHDSEEESADDIEVTMVTTSESERYRPLRNLDEQDYQLIMSPHGWLDGAIIHSAQVLLQKINPLIEGFQRPTLGPVRNFNVVSGEFVQLLHTGQDHWVCVSSIGCIPGTVRLFDSLYHDIISQEVEDQVKDLVLAESFQKLEYAPCQQQRNGSDCGVFAIAFATSLVFGSNPQNLNFDITKMRPHLVACLQAGLMSEFPSS